MHALCRGTGTYAIGLIQSLWLGVPLSLSLVGMVSGTTFVCLLAIVYLWLFWEFIRTCWQGYRSGMPEAFGQMKIACWAMSWRRARVEHVPCLHGQRRVLRGLHESIFSAAMKASCGISTLPNWRIASCPPSACRAACACG
jgi:hypothetical protein